MGPGNPQLRQALSLLDAGRTEDAISLLDRLAEERDGGALFILGQLKWRGGFVPQDLPAARGFYRRAGEAGNAAGAAFYTNLLASGIAGPRDWTAALRRLKEEAKSQPRRRELVELLQKMNLDTGGDPVDLPNGEPLSSSPEVILFPGLVSHAECQHLRATAEPGYGPSIVNDASGRTIRDPIRTSDGSTIQWLMEDPFVHAINRRLAAASGSSADRGEALQILRYQPGQQYRTHSDYIPGADNPRVLTALIYLNDDYEGGETRFVRTGLKVKGRKGDVLVFRSAHPDGRADEMSDHAGLPVTAGTKYLASRWIRERRWTP